MKMPSSGIFAHESNNRVTMLEQKGTGVLTFQRVDIVYGDGSPFYRGWIQFFGTDDGRTGPTVFPQNYALQALTPEAVHRKAAHWTLPVITQENAEIREARAEDLEQIIDLRFQSYFDGGYERISAYQALNQKIDDQHLTMVFTVDGQIHGVVYTAIEQETAAPTAYVDCWFCAPGLRRRGVGSALMQATKHRLEELGVVKITAKIIGDGAHAESVAKALDRCGFVVDEAYEDALGMVNAQMSCDL